MSGMISTRVHSRIVSLKLECAPNVAYRWGPGEIRPTAIRITYWYPEGKAEPVVEVYLYGLWIREDGEATEDPVDQGYDQTNDDWPDWLPELVTDNRS